VLRCYGREGLQSLIREHLRLAQLFASWVEEAPGWEIVAPHRLSVVCFRHEGTNADNEAILERVNASGEVYLSQTRLDGRLVLRLAIGNARTIEDDVRRAWAALQAAAT
jgi:aromatic-L-amino-acid decarboxylase